MYPRCVRVAPGFAMIKHFLIACLQVAILIAVAFLVVIGFMLHAHGWAYLDTAGFRTAIGQDVKYAIAAGVLLIVVVICYRVTRRTLDP